MYRVMNVVDLNSDDIWSRQYDLGIFASGYESRCVATSERLSAKQVEMPIILGFSNEVLPDARKRHDLHFRQKWSVDPIKIEHSDFDAAWKQMGAIVYALMQSKKERLRILVDYSSMSRAWYAGILNFVRFLDTNVTIEIDFCYTIGHYGAGFEEELRTSVVNRIVSLPGLEGLSGTRESTVAALGLGFTPVAALGVLERLQPSVVFSFLAEPGAEEGYSEICRDANASIIAMSRFIMPLPLRSVAVSSNRLSEAILPFLDHSQVTFIPMGPKPHVLASMLTAARYKQAACLYASISRKQVSDISPLEEIVATRVTFAGKRPSAA